MSSPEPGANSGSGDDANGHSQRLNPPRLTQAVEPDRCIKVLLATDNHVGYAENDPVRGRDSINSFREILELAVANDVDLLLLAGDLFHENRPSRTSLYQVISSLREFTQGRRPIELDIVSDAGIGIRRDATWPSINYLDENINVGLPVFSIHGNHDDPQGTGAEGALCALDILSASGLINYFGRTEIPGASANDEDVQEDGGIVIKPILLQKGSTKLALYGIGNVRDDRFHYEMKNSRVEMHQPVEDADEWFNIVLVHQNRVAHGKKSNNTSDGAFSDDAHLIVWGHEHDCIEQATPVSVPGRPYYIVQPGSSVATSLAKGEAIPKHVSLIKIQGKEFEFEPIRLRTVRPFIFEDISLSEAHDPSRKVNLKDKVAVNRYLKGRVNDLIARANAEWAELNPDLPASERLLPLIRIRVDYGGGPDGNGVFEIGNPQRFGQDFVDKVANPRDIVQFHRKAARASKKVDMDHVDKAKVMAAIEESEDIGSQMEKLKVSSLVTQYLSAQNLGVLSEEFMQRAIEEYVDKGDRDAIADMLKKSVKDAVANISKTYIPSKDGPEHDHLENEALVAKDYLTAKYAPKPNKSKGKQKRSQDSDTPQEEEEEEERDSMADSAASSDDGRRGRKKAAPPAKKKGRAMSSRKKQNELFLSDDDDDDDDDVVVQDQDDDEESDVISDSPPPKKAPAKKVAASTRKTVAPAKTKAVPLPKPKAKAPAATQPKRAVTQQVVSTDSDDDS
ncbi:BQ5605_C013g07313 [Microbotryum silenes-dioicae]|uniref:Double-strand break repair protein n=1 Tax=Microbotryum silenes-dioicae TaxID=796604 RepID=A0A2X0NNY1_9BASI|nr:BQ5605_C013g07313 [Microbotryum silenes-dioicae]